MTGGLGESLDSTSGRFDGIKESVTQVASAVAETLGEALEAVWGFLVEKFGPVWDDFVNFVEETLMPALRDIWEAILEKWLPAFLQGGRVSERCIGAGFPKRSVPGAPVSRESLCRCTGKRASRIHRHSSGSRGDNRGDIYARLGESGG